MPGTTPLFYYLHTSLEGITQFIALVEQEAAQFLEKKIFASDQQDTTNMHQTSGPTFGIFMLLGELNHSKTRHHLIKLYQEQFPEKLCLL